MEEKKLYNAVRKIITLADGRQIEIETGKLAKQADGSVVVKMGDTMLLGTVVAAKDAKPDTDFMPLQVEYKEKYAACGRYPGGFMKREGKANDSEILVARLIDRALRPLFPADYHAEVYVTVTLISADKDIQPDALAGLAASAALAVSDIPFGGPISEVRVVRRNGEYAINPNFSEMPECDLDIMVGGTIDNILMVEGEMKEVSEEVMLGAIKFAHEEIKKHCAVQIELSKELGKDVKRTYCHEVNDEELRQTIIRELYDKAYAIATSGTMKHEREDLFNALEQEFATSHYTEEELVEKAPLIHKYFHDDVQKKAMRRMILDEGKRLDGRRTDEIRPIWCEVGYLPAAHGSAIFTRGETQALATVTLGTKLDEKVKDEVLVQGTEQFVLHYNFPPFSTGEAKASRGLSRREIGHGHLAWRALKPMIPLGEENPYAVRVVSDILESNGSSSMATVCAGTLALMDAGVKIKKPVSGIAMGLISDSESGKWAVLSDILGDEDHLGDMDFKVTGTKDGITATQMDIKVDGLSYEVLAAALEQARKGRMYILGKITECIAEPRADYKPCVPRIVQITIPQDMIGSVIGPGGKVIQDIQKTTNTTITITEVDNKGIVDIFGVDKAALDGALARIKAIVAIPEVGETYHGRIRSIVAFGAFVEIMPGKDALLHISEIDYKRFETMEETGLKEGDEIDVKLIGIDPKTGKLKLSRKALLPKPEGYVERERRPRPERGERRERREHKGE
ncbi:polyribonucleotide nucleotidyltransferase [Alistipes sp. CAG:268]|jgi:polyribonucleotide nucleotidyltransferase|uniref:polyribonucleotide nucleotidyltransferase n=1 Tax=Alistipes sp. CAG:268 TaxID=1262693 RepID=UPI000334A9BA|nr:polyribonucleotide nucleotidyltransferase [Alistipes sp. CAG:268]CDC96682.1 polyribonucleotide nucleotidyltransferase [Alistipes sp. CAG:268]HBL70895.1 polyribonucleotide nucleotidyltransferase [Alistipes sp.]HBW01073.1 polyribonucleotide nucleotidyltransferase [Alistipes sp.]HIX97686.1 polyribonucleotide nucleotidyltransferase [Candidatus Alistipes avistercoris]